MKNVSSKGAEACVCPVEVRENGLKTHPGGMAALLALGEGGFYALEGRLRTGRRADPLAAGGILERVEEAPYAPAMIQPPMFST